MNHSSIPDLPSTSSNSGKRGASLTGASDSFSAKADDGDKAAGDKSVATAKEGKSTLKPAVDRVLSSGGALVKDTAAATREATAEAKRLGTRAIKSTETFVSLKPKRSVVIAAAVGAAAATLVLSKKRR